MRLKQHKMDLSGPGPCMKFSKWTGWLLHPLVRRHQAQHHHHLVQTVHTGFASLGVLRFNRRRAHLLPPHPGHVHHPGHARSRQNENNGAAIVQAPPHAPKPTSAATARAHTQGRRPARRQHILPLRFRPARSRPRLMPLPSLLPPLSPLSQTAATRASSLRRTLHTPPRPPPLSSSFSSSLSSCLPPRPSKRRGTMPLSLVGRGKSERRSSRYVCLLPPSLPPSFPPSPYLILTPRPNPT